MEENFDSLQKLLALKRHEVPPPGYFNTFSSKVMARIEAAETRPVTWLQKLGLDFDFKPAMVCGLGVLVCGLLSAGVLTSALEPNHQLAPGLVMAPPMNPSAEAAPFGPVVAGDASRSSTQPVFSASRFDQFGLQPQPVSYQFQK
jgi:hypothetical protein